MKCTKLKKCEGIKKIARINDERKSEGMYILDYMNLETGEQTQKLIVYKKDKKVYLLAFCPCCGVKQTDFVEIEE